MTSRRRKHSSTRNGAAVLDRDPPQLTVRETEVLQLLGRGYSYKDVGATLDLSVNTVGTHVRHIYRKLNVSSKSTAILTAITLGIVLAPPRV